MRTVVFINAHSRQAAANIEAVREFFGREDSTFELLDFIVVEELEQFKDALKRLRGQKKAECIIVGSGDGTIVTVLNHLQDRHKNITYGFLPLGTSNTFVRSLGLPIDFKKALQVLEQKTTRTASLGSINGTLFANIADIGVPAQVANRLTNRVKRYFGSFAYALSGIRELIRHDAIWCELTIGDVTQTFYTHQVFVANGKYRGPVKVSKDTSVYTGTLTLGYSATMSRWEYLRDAFGFIIGSTDKRKNLYFVPIEHATLRTKPRQIIQADGEIIGKTPAEIHIVKDAIRVLVPAEELPKPRGKLRSTRQKRKQRTTA